VSEQDLDTELRIRVDPEPSPEIMAAIVTAIHVRRSRLRGIAEPAAPQPSRWAMAGRHEAMTGRDGAGPNPWDRR
jgi:hypothetical protein